MSHLQFTRWTRSWHLVPALLLAVCCCQSASAQYPANRPNNGGRGQANNLQPLPQPVVIYLPPGWQPWSSARPNNAPSPYYAPYPNNSQSPYYGPPSTSALSPFPVQVQVRPYTAPQPTPATPTYAAPRAPMNEEIPGEDQDWPIGTRRRSPFVARSPDDHESAPLFKNPAAVQSQPGDDRGLVSNQPPAKQFPIAPEKPNESAARRGAGDSLARQPAVPGASDKANGGRSPQSRVVQGAPQTSAPPFVARTTPQAESPTQPKEEPRPGATRKPQSTRPSVADKSKGLIPRPRWVKPSADEDQVALIPNEKPQHSKPQPNKPEKDALADQDDEDSKPLTQRGPLGALTKMLPSSKSSSKENTTKASPPKTSSPPPIARFSPGADESSVSIRPAAPPIPRSTAATRQLASKMAPRINVAGNKPAAAKPDSQAPAAMIEPRMVARRMSEPPAAASQAVALPSAPTITGPATAVAETPRTSVAETTAPATELAQADTAKTEPESASIAPADESPTEAVTPDHGTTEVASVDKDATKDESTDVAVPHEPHVAVPHIAAPHAKGPTLATASPSEVEPSAEEHHKSADNGPTPHLAATGTPHVAHDPVTEPDDSPAVMPTLDANGGSIAKDDGDEHLLARASRIRRRPAPAAASTAETGAAEDTAVSPRLAVKEDETPMPPALSERESRSAEPTPARTVAAPREMSPKAESNDKLVSSGPKSPRVVRRNPIREQKVIEEARRGGNPLR